MVGMVIALGATACGGNDSSGVDDHVVNTDARLSDADFATFIKNHTAAFDSSSDANIVKAAKSVCNIFDAGGNFNDVMGAISMSGVDPYDAGYLAGAGVANYCPEYQHLVK